MLISSLPAPVDFNESRLNSIEYAIRWPAPLNTVVGWVGWDVELRLDRLPVISLSNGGLTIDDQGRLIWKIPASTVGKMSASTGYDLVFIAPDGVHKNYWRGRINLS